MEFTEFEEENVILLALDHPEFFHKIIKFLKIDYFEQDHHKYIMNTYIEFYEKYDDVPTKEALKNIIYKELKGSDELSEPIMEILDKEFDPRNAKYIKDHIIKWARAKQMLFLYSEDIMEEVRNGNVEKIEEIIDLASAISDIAIKPFRFFDDIERLFIENEYDHFTTGFSRLDEHIHNGRGPARKEVLIWVAPTGVGKSIMLVNTAVQNVLKGKKVLHISLENSNEVTGDRYLGVFTRMPIASKKINKDKMISCSKKLKNSSEGELLMVYFPTDTVSTRELEVAIKDIRIQCNFTPDVIVVDYLECLLSKNPYKNKTDYDRQKSVSSEIRALGSITDAFVATASQTNRGGVKTANEGGNLNLDNLAESFGKAMPADYVISINQSQSQYNNNQCEQNKDSSDIYKGLLRFFFAKNRNGPKFKTVNAQVDYTTMIVTEENISA